jgi:hypothetical protein
MTNILDQIEELKGYFPSHYIKSENHIVKLCKSKEDADKDKFLSAVTYETLVNLGLGYVVLHFRKAFGDSCIGTEKECKIDMVNSPSHYKDEDFPVETIDILKWVVEKAPDTWSSNMHYQTLKYLLRLWKKENPLEDAKKSQWYLTRLIKHLEENPND